jgi:hypothetical protein
MSILISMVYSNDQLLCIIKRQVQHHLIIKKDLKFDKNFEGSKFDQKFI